MLRIQPRSAKRSGLFVRLSYWVARRRLGKVPAPVGIMAHNRWVLAAVAGYELAQERAHALAPRLKDLANLKVATEIGCRFCIDIGSAIAESHGLTQAELEALPFYRDSTLFSTLERRVLDYAVCMSRVAFLRVLERLTPVERAVYLLHAVFDSSHAEIAAMLGKDEATVRQVFHRAKANVLSERPRFAPSKEAHARLLGSFVDACTRGDVTALRSLLADDATAWTDGGGRVRAALKPLFGSDAVARFFVGVVRKGAGDGIAVSLAEVNGWPTVVGRRGDTTTTTLSIETDGNKIFAVHVVSNPEKLLRV